MSKINVFIQICYKMAYFLNFIISVMTIDSFETIYAKKFKSLMWKKAFLLIKVEHVMLECSVIFPEHSEQR